MNWVERMNAVIDRIEEMLTDDVRMDELARMIGMSPYHFQTVFACMTDLSVSEYVRRRRMSRAAAELQSGEKVLDVALKYGYQSPTSFNRAFRQVHGIAPSEAQKPGALLKTYPPIRFQITIKGAEEMKYSIRSMEAFTVMVKKREFQLEDCFETVPAYWDEYCGTEMPPVCGCFGICCDPCDGSGAFTYMIGDRWTDMVAGGKMGTKLVLVMTGRGDEAVGKDREKWAEFEPVHIAQNLLEAVKWIIQQETK